MPKDFKTFIGELEKNLKIYSLLKAKFAKKFKSVPFGTLKSNNYEEMLRIKKKSSEAAFLEKAYLLGFPRGKRPYVNLSGKTLSEFDQAVDYINLLFCFDDVMHQTINQAVERKQKLKIYYKYINTLGE